MCIRDRGSAVLMLASVLKAAGLRVGATVSPFVLDFRERFQLNGEMISREEMCIRDRGRDEWLFYKNVYDSRSLDDYQGLNLYSPEQLGQIAADPVSYTHLCIHALPTVCTATPSWRSARAAAGARW